MNNKRALVNLYKSTHFLYGIVYQQQHKSRDSNRCLSAASKYSHEVFVDWFDKWNCLAIRQLYPILVEKHTQLFLK